MRVAIAAVLMLAVFFTGALVFAGPVPYPGKCRALSTPSTMACGVLYNGADGIRVFTIDGNTVGVAGPGEYLVQVIATGRHTFGSYRPDWSVFTSGYSMNINGDDWYYCVWLASSGPPSGCSD